MVLICFYPILEGWTNPTPPFPRGTILATLRWLDAPRDPLTRDTSFQMTYGWLANASLFQEFQDIYSQF